jgi:hypothetical protein
MGVLPSMLVDKRGVTIVVGTFGVLESLDLDMSQEKYVDVFVDEVLASLEELRPVLASGLLWAFVVGQESVGAIVAVEVLLAVVIKAELLESGEGVEDDGLDALLGHLPCGVTSVDELAEGVDFLWLKLRLRDSTVGNQVVDAGLLRIIVELGGGEGGGELCLADARGSGDYSSKGFWPGVTAGGSGLGVFISVYVFGVWGGFGGFLRLRSGWHFLRS